ncbi:MAG: hypothetical protein NDJ18_00870 [candidate division Zixibacteria bacterium]|nr:hypothetical protein [candidate division Zixibacteria bacterium]
MLRQIIIGTAVLGGLLLAGCSDSPTGSMNQITTVGGYTATNEAPAFGDPLLMASSAQEVQFNDPIAATPILQTLLADPDAGLYHLRVVWGQLRYDSTVTTPTDWSGSLTISRGAELVRRVIRFEPATDSILPRTDRRVIEWASQTTVHNDGIAFDLIVPPARPTLDTILQIIVDTLTNDTTVLIVVDTIPAPPVTVQFTAGSYSRAFSLPEIAALDTVVYFEDSSGIAFNGFKVDRIRCPRGFLSGFWGYDSTGQGVFRGSWISQHGEVDGHVQGHFEKDSTGARVFFGKWIDASGLFEGFLHGRWKDHPNPHADSTAFLRAGGWFAGLLLDDQTNPIGMVAGHYISSKGNPPGFFQGRWKLNCDPNGSEDGMDQLKFRRQLEDGSGWDDD